MYLKPEPFGIIRSICPPTKDSIDTSLSTQYTDGLYGPLIIHDPDATGIMALGKGYDEERIVFMGDWYHTYSSVLLQQYMGNLFGKKEVDSRVRPGMVSPCSRNRTATRHHPDQRMQQVELSVSPGLDPRTNHTAKSCTGGELYNLRVETVKVYRLRLINPGTYAGLYFTIDSHNLTIIEADGTDITPIEVPGIFVNIGQRYSILFNASQPAGNYLMR